MYNSPNPCSSGSQFRAFAFISNQSVTLKGPDEAGICNKSLSVRLHIVVQWESCFPFFHYSFYLYAFPSLVSEGLYRSRGKVLPQWQRYPHLQATPSSTLHNITPITELLISQHKHTMHKRLRNRASFKTNSNIDTANVSYHIQS